MSKNQHNIKDAAYKEHQNKNLQAALLCDNQDTVKQDERLHVTKKHVGNIRDLSRKCALTLYLGEYLIKMSIHL